MTYKYLASPYSHNDPEVMAERYREVRDATAWLLQRRVWIYSPIVHSHDMNMAHGMPTDAAFWSDYNRAMIERSSGLLVLTIDGWSESKGIAGERAFAKMLGLPVSRLDYRPGYRDVIPAIYQFGQVL